MKKITTIEMFTRKISDMQRNTRGKKFVHPKLGMTHGVPTCENNARNYLENDVPIK